MYSCSPLHDVVISAILDMARPGILDRVYIPAGVAEITNGMPLLRCLSALDDAETPDDVPEAIMPRWAVWLTCGIADNLSEPDYIAFSRALADMLSGLAEDDNVWPAVKLAFVRNMVDLAASLVAPVVVKDPHMLEASRLATDAVSRASRVPSQALSVLLARLGMSRDELADTTLIEEKVFLSDGGSLSDIRSLPDALHVPYRLAVWGTMLLAGDHKMARRMVADYDWTAFLLVSGVGIGGANANAGLDWAGLGRWLVDAVAEAIEDRDVSADDIILL
jgi:hypothetical protein